MRQLKLNLNKGRHGGRRSGSGRKRIYSKGVAHRIRETVSSRTPCHVNFKYKCHIKNKDCLKLLKRAIANSRAYGLRIIHFSLQHNHIHIITEPTNNEILTRGMRSLTITFAKGLNQGKVQIERYHLHVLRTLREAKNAVHYVLFNKQKHEKGTCSKIDEYCSLWAVSKWNELVKAYAKTWNKTLVMGKNEYWKQDTPHTYLLKRSLIT